MIKVLQELPSLDGGGVAKIVCDYYMHMDREKIHFDFLIYDYYDKGIYEDEMQALGCKIYKLTSYQKHKKECIRQIENLMKKNSFDVFHSHIGPQSIFSLHYAKKYGIKKRIVHSHGARVDGYTLKQRISIFLQDKVSARLATQLMACGSDAAIVRWGYNAYKKNKVYIMKNAIDVKAYQYNISVRNELRKELNVENQFVIGIVGRLESQKNYPFLFQVYQQYLKKRNNVRLLIVGRGPEENEIKDYAKLLEIDDQIIYLGVRKDVPKLLNAMDVFVLPSLYEGLPIVLVEAQSNGLPELVSDKVTKEMDVTGLIDFLPIQTSKIEMWVEKIAELENRYIDRTFYSKEMAQSGYDINVAAREIQEMYMNEEIITESGEIIC